VDLEVHLAVDLGADPEADQVAALVVDLDQGADLDLGVDLDLDLEVDQGLEVLLDLEVHQDLDLVKPK